MRYVIPASSIWKILTLMDLWEMEKKLEHFMQHEEKKARADEIIKNHVGFSLGAALMPLPGADLLAVSAVQLNMLRQLAKLYQVSFMDVLGKNIISAVAGSSVARVGASLVKAIPGVGTLIGELSMPALSGASTYALGKVVANHFDKGGTLENLDIKSAQKGYQQEVVKGQAVAEELNTATLKPQQNKHDDMLERIRKISEMKDAGILSEDEFKKLKERLLAE